MFRRAFLIAALAASVFTFLFAGAGLAEATSGAASQPPELPVLPEVRSIAGVARLSLTAAINPATSLPSFSYGGGTTPPTIRVKPGDTIVIDYTNALPFATQPPLDITNLHFHGLTVSPRAPGDQVVMTMIAPGQTYRYVVKIPTEQAPGLYWYHPHPHGESNRQVAGGMSGLIIVDGVGRYAPLVRGLAERDIILRDYYFDPSSNPLARERRRFLFHAAAVARAADPKLSFHDSVRLAIAKSASPTIAPDAPYQPDCDPVDAGNSVTINALPQVTLSMAPGSRQFFRVANTSANSIVNLSLDGSQLYVVGYDGVPLGFHVPSTGGYLTNNVFLPPAARVEFINASPLKDGAALRSACIDTGPAGDVNPAHILARIALRGLPAGLPIESSASRVAPPRSPAVDRRTIAAERVVDFSENNPESLFYINKTLWNPLAPPMFVAHTGTLEEWTVRNFAREVHVFHIHQIHFLVEDVNGVKQPPDTWRDTVAIPFMKRIGGVEVPGVVHLLMDFRDPVIAGTFVFHCHILEHEDGGMMAKIVLINPAAPASSNPFTAFVRATLAFFSGVADTIPGHADALAVIAHICGRAPQIYSTGPLSEGFVRRSGMLRVTTRHAKKPALTLS